MRRALDFSRHRRPVAYIARPRCLPRSPAALDLGPMVVRVLIAPSGVLDDRVDASLVTALHRHNLCAVYLSTQRLSFRLDGAVASCTV